MTPTDLQNLAAAVEQGNPLPLPGNAPEARTEPPRATPAVLVVDVPPMTAKERKQLADARAAEARADLAEAKAEQERRRNREQARQVRERREASRRPDVLNVELEPEEDAAPNDAAPNPLRWPVWPQVPGWWWRPAGAFLAGLVIMYAAPVIPGIFAAAALFGGDLGAFMGWGFTACAVWVLADVLYLRAYLRRQPWVPVVDGNGRPVLAGPGQVQEHETRNVYRGRLRIVRRSVPVPVGAVLARRPLTGLRRWIPAEAWTWEDRAPRAAGAGPDLRGLAGRLLHREDPEAELRRERLYLQNEVLRRRLEG